MLLMLDEVAAAFPQEAERNEHASLAGKDKQMLREQSDVWLTV